MNNNQSRPDLNWVNGHPMHAMQYGIESIVPDLWNGTKPELVINGPNKGNVIWPWLQRIPNAITAAYASAHYGIPAISFAYGSRNGNWSSWNTAKRPRNSRTYVGLVARLLGELQETHEAGKGLLPPDTYLNVNFPPLSATCKEVEDFHGALTEAERLDYVNAVKCLQGLPARTPESVATGAKSRFDDFIVTHVQQTLTIHFTGNFQPWHRWFVYVYERALRDECGYKGYQPYWDWPKYSSAPQDSPIFNGDRYSLGGNGDFVPHDGPIAKSPNGLPLPGLGMQLPPGLGGGYVTTGPFANMTINLGPRNSVAYNSRRIRRDVGPTLTIRYANYTTVLDMLRKSNIDDFRYLSEGTPYSIEIGPHIAAHAAIGGDPAGDLFISPGDPAFYTHHGMMDRMWTLWQAIDPATRRDDLGRGEYSHITWANTPPSKETNLSDILDLGYAGESIQIADVMDTLSGPFCYFYL
ncbi:hypothetical protein PLICBS_003707 [Purpureocillium lilacinum]|uniref:uncharacterized protein n=1 Tax=Purpureocillium lilacinum TaxID=33203 RepID=UPI0020883591|nr:hypothetical protein PLICBS_003707 [Purpureocillium lilacinum]